jgi:uncharacterized membrane protein
MTNRSLPKLLRRRWRTLSSVVAGVLAAILASRAGAPLGLSTLAGWDLGCLLFLVTTLGMMWGEDETACRARAAAEDEGQTLIMTIVLSAVVASLAATLVALREARAAGPHLPGGESWAWILSVSTLVLGWLMMQTVFTLRYAHQYFGDGDRDGTSDRGLAFPGEAPKTYRDFFYVSVCVGATAQVSDVDVTSARFRGLVTQHALLSFFYNTMVLALGINISATIIGQ